LYAVVAAVLLAGAGGGGYWYYTNHGGAAPGAGAGSATATPSPEVLNSRFEFAETLLEKGQVAQAFEVVQNILTIAPDNERARELQARIEEASAKQAQQKLEAEQPGGAQSSQQEAQTVAADAAMAIASGQLGQARELVDRGRQLDPTNARWDQLNEQIQQRARQLQTQQSQKQRETQIVAGIQKATKFLEVGDYDSAIASYDAVLDLDPASAAATDGRSRAVFLKQQVELERQRREELAQKAAVAPTRTIVESKTEFTAPSGQEAAKGFEMGGVEVKRATSAPTFPAELTIEVNPVNAQPGQPYVLSVRVHNAGNQTIHIKSLELISSYGGKIIGKGQPIPARTPQVSPRANAVLHEVQGTWTEEQNKGSIVANVQLVGGGLLTKSISW
jgi:hypothetical protein